MIAAEEARALRDDVDVWRERAMEHDKTRAELAQLRHKFEDAEYMSRRCDVCVWGLTRRLLLLALSMTN